MSLDTPPVSPVSVPAPVAVAPVVTPVTISAAPSVPETPVGQASNDLFNDAPVATQKPAPKVAFDLNF